MFKPLVEALSIVGGLELLHMPVLDYNLAEIPGISNIIRSLHDKIIKKGFVWPNRLSLYLLRPPRVGGAGAGPRQEGPQWQL